MSLETRKEILQKEAVRHFQEGYNCAQSVLLAMFEYWKGKSELIPKIATGFGGGIGRCGSVCGALAGGVMAIGIEYGLNEPSAKERLKCYSLSRRLYSQFEERYGTVLCRQLIGYDLADPEELRKARKTKVFEEKCHGFIRTVVEILLNLEHS